MSIKIPLYLFAKAPVAGLVKRRMCPPLNDVQAAQVATALLSNATQVVERAWPGQCFMSITPDLSHSAFSKHRQSDQWQITIQPKTDLGGRMCYALLEGINEAGCAAVLGTDIPNITAQILNQAHSLLMSGQQVVGPSLDGGFYLLGLHQMPKMLFNKINWGSDEVYTKLCENAAACGLELATLPTLPDCDCVTDLQDAVRHSAGLEQALIQVGFDLTLLNNPRFSSLPL